MTPVRHSKYLGRVLLFKRSLGPGSALGEKCEKRGQIGKISANEEIRGRLLEAWVALTVG